jgi:hypothetical protein
LRSSVARQEVLNAPPGGDRRLRWNRHRMGAFRIALMNGDAWVLNQTLIGDTS